MSEPMGVRGVHAHEPTGGSGTTPRLWLSIAVWLAAVALNVWAIADAVAERNTPYYCGELPISRLAVLAVAVSIVGLWRAPLHWNGPRVTFVIGVLVVIGAVVMIAVLNRPYGGCFD